MQVRVASCQLPVVICHVQMAAALERSSNGGNYDDDGNGEHDGEDKDTDEDGNIDVM